MSTDSLVYFCLIYSYQQLKQVTLNSYKLY